MKIVEPNWWDWQPQVEDGNVGPVWRMEDRLRGHRALRDSSHAGTDAWVPHVRRDPAEPDPEWTFSVMAGAWTLGEAFPAQTTPCGWKLEDRAVPLLDPSPCAHADGTSESAQLGYYLSTGTNQTTKLPTGGYRLYFGAAKLAQVATASTVAQYDWPTEDPGGRLKFAIAATGGAYGSYSRQQMEFWGARGSDYPALHFSKEFIGYLDSADGLTFPMYAPVVQPTAGTTCEDASYAGAAGTLADSTTGFWAGWRSTSLPTTGATVVYRDPSVVYVHALGRYLLFAVECDGRGLSTDGLGTDVTDGGGCSLCVPTNSTSMADWCVYDDRPKTRYVFFTCADPDFGANAKGPFAVAAAPPDYASGEWIGVPQAFLSPDGLYFLYYIPGPYAYCGLHIARIADLVADVATLEGFKAAGADVDGFGWLFDQHFVNLGPAVIECDTPSSHTTPTLTDEQFVFCADGRLHMYFTNRDSTDLSARLRLVSHAAAFEPWSASTIEALFADAIPTVSEVPAWTPRVAESTSALPPCYFQHLLGIPCLDTSLLWNADVGAGLVSTPAPITAEDILVNFRMADCDPVYMSELLGGTEITDVYGDTLVVEVNDPNVYLAATGEYVMLVQCGALGGLVRLTADVGTACASREAC